MRRKGVEADLVVYVMTRPSKQMLSDASPVEGWLLGVFN